MKENDEMNHEEHHDALDTDEITDNEWVDKSIIDEILVARDSLVNMARRDDTSEEDYRLLMIAVSSIDWLVTNYCAIDKAYNAYIRRSRKDEDDECEY